MIYVDGKQFKFYNSCVTLGKFDGLHKGHMVLAGQVLKEKEKGRNTVLFTFDMPRKSIYSSFQKRDIIEKLGFDVCVVYPFDEATKNMSAASFVRDVLVKQLDTKKIVVGEDFCFGHEKSGNVRYLESVSGIYGFELSIIKKIKSGDEIISSTNIKKYLDMGDVHKASMLLGREYSIEGTVKKGEQIGRTIGFPTANIIPDEDIYLPKYGVYESEVIVDGKLFRGITNIGNRPTVNGKNTSVETYIKDFSEDIYGKIITVVLKKFIRPEQRFNSVDELKTQITVDLSCLC